MNDPEHDRLDQLVDTDPLALRDEAFALLARAERAEALLPQLERAEAALDRVKHLAINALPTGCGAGWDLNPADILKALDQAGEAT